MEKKNEKKCTAQMLIGYDTLNMMGYSKIIDIMSGEIDRNLDYSKCIYEKKGLKLFEIETQDKEIALITLVKVFKVIEL